MLRGLPGRDGQSPAVQDDSVLEQTGPYGERATKVIKWHLDVTGH
jgi:hypothetical protein